MAGNNDVFHVPGSPSITDRHEMLKKKGASGLGSLLDDNQALHFPPLPPRNSQDHDVNNEVRNTNRDSLLGAILSVLR